MKNGRIQAALCVAAVILSACSVREDREECPCRVNVNLDDFAGTECRRGVLTVIGPLLHLQDSVSAEDCFGRGYDVEVRRTGNSFSYVAGCGSLILSSDSLYCEKGSEWGEVTLGFRREHCNADMVKIRLSPRKEFCTVNFIFMGTGPDEEAGCRILVRSGCVGLSLGDGGALKGEYEAYARLSAESGTFSVRVPRQPDDGLAAVLLACGGKNDAGADEEIDTLPIGKMMEANGYDWTKESLDDVFITIDATQREISVEVKPWNDRPLDIEI